MPGTVGSIGSVVIWFLISKWFFDQQVSIFLQNIFWGIIIVLALIYGSFAIPSYVKNLATKSSKKDIDHQSIVLDEFVGQVLALQFTFFFLYQDYFLNLNLMVFHVFFCFVFFRFFDITKPSFIGYCDRNFKSGFGVMLDDLLCGVVVSVVGSVVFFVFTL